MPTPGYVIWTSDLRLVDGTGGGGSVKTIETMGYTYVPANPAWDWVVATTGTVPMLATTQSQAGFAGT